MSQLHSRALALLRESLDRDGADFHEDQWESIATLVEGRGRLLVVQRTGWGKSAVYFIATRLLRDQGYGPTLIISPLLALMRNQAESAARYGVRLGTVNSANTRAENDASISAALAGELDALIISPERLANAEFVEGVLRPIGDRIGLFVVDEAHCISDWGHDFRPDYKRIGSILRFLPPNMPVLATTATANERVTQDIAGQLGDHPTIFRGALTRESLHLQAIPLPAKSQRLAWLAERLPEIDGTGIVYVATTRDADLVAEWLRSRGLKVEAYYGTLRGLSAEENRARRRELENALLENRVKALVATSALGMGFDKPDLSFVIHFQSPGSVVGYYQQVGRAGRGIPKAWGVLLSGNEDHDIQQFFIRNAFPDEQLVTQVLESIESAEEGLTVRDLERRVNGGRGKIDAAIRFLAAESPAPILRSSVKPVRYSRTLTDYELPHDTIRRVSEIKQREWGRMREYLRHDGCLMRFLGRELDDHETRPCGKCAHCAPGERISELYSHEIGLAAAEYLANVPIVIPPKKRAGTKADVSLRFPETELPPSFGDLAHEPGRALCRWGEAGWGEVAMRGKRDGAFDPGLVGASADLIATRWRPAPSPTWVTCVPSLRHPALVPDFARALAEELGIPFVDVVRVLKPNCPQKEMENTYHRCRNLDGAFHVSDVPSEGPVLLVDDAVDSGWTFAVVAALLRRAGSGPVVPFAITSTSTGG